MRICQAFPPPLSALRLLFPSFLETGLSLFLFIRFSLSPSRSLFSSPSSLPFFSRPFLFHSLFYPLLMRPPLLGLAFIRSLFSFPRPFFNFLLFTLSLFFPVPRSFSHLYSFFSPIIFFSDLYSPASRFPSLPRPFFLSPAFLLPSCSFFLSSAPFSFPALFPPASHPFFSPVALSRNSPILTLACFAVRQSQ